MRDKNKENASVVSILFFQSPALAIAEAIIAPIQALADIILWGVVLPWSLVAFVAKANK